MSRQLEDVLFYSLMSICIATIALMIAAFGYAQSSKHHCMRTPCHVGKRVFADDQCFCATEVMK